MPSDGEVLVVPHGGPVRVRLGDAAARLGLQILDPDEQRVQADADEVGQQGVVEVGGRGGAAGMLAVDDLAGHPDDDRIGWDRPDHHGVGAGAAVVADRDRAEYLGAGPDGHPVAYGRMPFAVLQAGAAEGDSVVDRHVGTNLGGFPDDDAGGVVDEQPGAEYRAGVDVHSGEQAGQRREETAGWLVVALPQPVADPVSPHRVQARVAQHQLSTAACGRIPFSGRLKISSHGSQHCYSPRSANSGVLRYRSPKSGTTTTISLPAFSGRGATWTAAQTAAPDEMPTSSPSSRAIRRAMSNAASFCTVRISSMRSSSRTTGTKPAPIPWIG